MKKKFMVFTILAIISMVFIYFRFIYGWYEFRFYKKTPDNFLNKTMISKNNYSFDSINITEQIQRFIIKHQESFYSKEYDNSTVIIVDTILYSPDYKKIATFIIAKNSTNRQLVPDKNNDYYFDGFLFIGTKNGDSLRVNSTGEGTRNFKKFAELSSELKNLFFKKYSSTKDGNGKEKLYNLNDIRYWEKSIDWENLDYNRKMKRLFEEEKLKNPENVYEPKRTE